MPKDGDDNNEDISEAVIQQDDEKTNSGDFSSRTLDEAAKTSFAASSDSDSLSVEPAHLIPPSSVTAGPANENDGLAEFAAEVRFLFPVDFPLY
jgi:hypothetical protein